MNYISALFFSTTTRKDRASPLMIYTLLNTYILTIPPHYLSPVFWRTNHYYTNPAFPNISLVKTLPSYLSPILWCTQNWYKKSSFCPLYTTYLVLLCICLFVTPSKINTYHNLHPSSGKHIFTAPCGTNMKNTWLHGSTAQRMQIPQTQDVLPYSLDTVWPP